MFSYSDHFPHVTIVYGIWYSKVIQVHKVGAIGYVA